MTLIFDSNIAKKLNLNPSQYLVAQACASYAPMMKSTSAIHQDLNMASSYCSTAIRHLVDVGLLEVAANGSYYPTPKWYIAHDGDEVEVVSSKEKDAAQVIEYFNDVNGTKYQVPANIELVTRLMKTNPKLTIDHFKSVIVHKHRTWGTDEKMAQYNRPSTLFSNKFMRYLDEANHYWMNESKRSTLNWLSQ